MKNLESGDVMNSETDTERKPKLEDSFGGTIEKNIPDDVEWIDDAFYIKKTRFGLYTSILKNPLGQHFITGATMKMFLQCLDGILCVFKKEHLMITPVL